MDQAKTEQEIQREKDKRELQRIQDMSNEPNAALKIMEEMFSRNSAMLSDRFKQESF